MQAGFQKMIKTILAPFIALFTSGVLFHRCTIFGIICAVWVVFGAETEESIFGRLLTWDLYLLMFCIFLLFRLTLKRTLIAKDEIDLKSTLIFLLGDMAWGTLAMFCATFFLLTFAPSDKKSASSPYATIEQATEKLPPHVKKRVKQELNKFQVPFM